MHEESLFSVALPSQRRLRFRSLHHNESDALRDFYARLTPRTRYLRFFSPMPALPDTVVDLLTAEGAGHVSLVAAADDNTQDIIALGSFGAVDDRSGEVALVVRDDWQRQGVGTALATRVMAVAETRGFHRFIAHLLSENIGIRRLLDRLGQVLSVKSKGGIVEIAFVPRKPASA